jgi:hypothetical protein
MRNLALLAVAVLATCVAVASATAASQQRYAVAFTAPVTVSNMCPFDLDVVSTVNGFEVDHFNDDGALVGLELQVTEQDRYSAHGKTLVGVPISVHLIQKFDADGNVISAVGTGVYVKVRLPDGQLWMTAGHVDLTQVPLGSWIFEPDNGHWSDTAPFCAALS